MNDGDVAVIGMACVFPGAPDLGAYWRNLSRGRDAIGPLPEDRWPGHRGTSLPADHPAAIPCRRGGFIQTPYHFDAARHRVMPNVARHGDPDQFLLLDVLADALADAGVGPDDDVRRETDLIVGRGGYTSNKMMEVFLRADGIGRLTDFLRQRLVDLGEDVLDEIERAMRASLPPYDVDGLASSIPNLVPSRAANRLDLGGAAFTVDAACASSLVAVENAIERLRHGRCRLALAAGINFTHVPAFWYLFTRILAMSPSETIRPFDQRADGMLIGEGAGALVLKRALDAQRDGDRVWAVLRGVGTASDGRAGGVLAPASAGQVRALERAYRDAGVEPETISFIEAHGTGTPAGDGAEIETLRAFFGPPRGGPPHRVLGSVKSMIGHTMPAAGMASLIKTALALSNKILPPTLHCEKPHPALAETVFYVSAETRPWLHDPAQPRRAGVNAFGFGGINAHVVLEEAGWQAHPARRALAAQGQAPDDLDEALSARPVSTGVARASEVLLFSAPDAPGLAARLRRAARFLHEDPTGADVEDLAFTAMGEADVRAPWRLALVADAGEDVVARLEALAKEADAGTLATRERDLVFVAADAVGETARVAAVFPGLGFPGLAGAFPRHLLENALHFPVVRETFDVVEARDHREDDPLPTSFLLVPPAHLDAEERAALQARFAPPAQVRNGAGGGEVAANERTLAHLGMLVNNHANWRILEALGVPVSMLCGQSLGDVSAILAADMASFEVNVPGFWKVFDLDLPQANEGLMAVVGAGEAEVLPFLEGTPRVGVGLHLSPETLVIGGPEADVRSVCGAMREARILAQTLPFPPIHTAEAVGLEEAYDQAFGTLARLRRGRLTVYSSILAAPMPEDPREVERLLRSNVSRPIRFWQTVHRMYADGARTFVQIGSGTMAANGRTVLDRDDAVFAAMDVAHRAPLAQIQALVGRLFVQGIGTDREGLFPGRRAVDRVLDEPRPAPSPPRTAVELTLYAPPLVPDAPAAPPPRSPPRAPAPAPARPGRLPFLGRVLAHEAGRRIVMRVGLDLREHRYLEDHVFANVGERKPLAERLPVVPLTMTLEMLAEAAACLAPGQGLVAIADVRARRWIAFEDTEHLDVEVEARAVRGEGEGVVVEGAARIAGEEVARARLEFARTYRQTLQPTFHAERNAAPLPVKAEDLYTSGFLFHGPRFRAIADLGLRGRRSLTATLVTLERAGLFASEPRPQFLTDPVVLDAAGQLVGAFFHGREGHALPVAVERIEFYRPPPPPGVRLPSRVEFTEIDSQGRRTSANMEVQDGQGAVWFRIQGWQDVLFRWGPRLLASIRRPTRDTLSEPFEAAGLPDDGVAVRVEASLVRDLPPAWLARNHLEREALAAWKSLDATARRRRAWLLGRIAVKDAARLWLARRAGSDVLRHPVEVHVEV
ncbi:MAG: beta-ketoacyl synthase N-terminal-like domain-containing protein, partial [Planctomycetota bacterium]